MTNVKSTDSPSKVRDILPAGNTEGPTDLKLDTYTNGDTHIDATLLQKQTRVRLVSNCI